MEEADLIQGLKEGDSAMFRILVEKYQVPLVRLCLGFLREEDDAKDVVQDTFIEVFQSIGQFRAEAKLSTWLYRIAVNKSINLNRRKKVNRIFVRMDVFTPGNSQNAAAIPAENLTEPPGYNLEQTETRKQLRKAMDSLPGNQKIAFLLHKVQGLAYLEISEIMEVSLSSVESLIHRARINLQKKLYGLYKNNLL